MEKQSGALADIQREMSDTVRILLDAEEIPNQISEVNSKIQETKHKIRLITDFFRIADMKKDDLFIYSIS